MRFNFDANTEEEAIKYLKARAKQLLRFGFKLNDIIIPERGVIDAYFEKDGKLYQSIYILNDYRGEGLYKKYIINDILTSDDCGISGYLTKNNIEFISVDLYEFEEYKIISDFYGSKIAKRSGVELMNHIDEGLAILEHIGASNIAKRAYCLHPIIQSDDDLFDNRHLLKAVDSEVIIATVEYRSVANEYLSTRDIKSIDEIRLSPLNDVCDMLIADKIQNRKDFELYHLGKHIKSDRLDKYFKNWLERLNVQEFDYHRITELIK